jgi:hypothetical protein
MPFLEQGNCNERDFTKYYISDSGIFSNPSQAWSGFRLSIKIFFLFTQLADLVFRTHNEAARMLPRLPGYTVFRP